MSKQPAKAPWKKPKPKTGKATKLTPQEIEIARDRAEKAGRRYPNLIDNMAVIKLRKTRKDLP